jgi:hypothetical protein
VVNQVPSPRFGARGVARLLGGAVKCLVVAAMLPVLLVACETSISRDPVYRETEVRQSRPRLLGESFDSQESYPRLKSAFDTADRKAERAVGNVPRDAEFITRFWDAKRRILSREFGITWRTPAELNPQIT